jgi:cobalamin biosynthesis protein CobT
MSSVNDKACDAIMRMFNKHVKNGKKKLTLEEVGEIFSECEYDGEINIETLQKMVTLSLIGGQVIEVSNAKGRKTKGTKKDADKKNKIASGYNLYQKQSKLMKDLKMTIPAWNSLDKTVYNYVVKHDYLEVENLSIELINNALDKARDELAKLSDDDKKQYLPVERSAKKSDKKGTGSKSSSNTVSEDEKSSSDNDEDKTNQNRSMTDDESSSSSDESSSDESSSDEEKKSSSSTRKRTTKNTKRVSK